MASNRPEGGPAFAGPSGREWVHRQDLFEIISFNSFSLSGNTISSDNLNLYLVRVKQITHKQYCDTVEHLIHGNYYTYLAQQQ